MGKGEIALVMQELKMKYNYILNRYYNGCNYIEAHPEEFDKYIDKVMMFKKELEEILSKIQEEEKTTESEILGGFNIC